MNNIVAAVQSIGHATGNDKLILLKRYENVPGLKEVLRFIYNPYCRTGISSAKLSRALAQHVPDEGLLCMSWQDAIEYFKTHQTGTDTDLAYASRFIRACRTTYGQDAARLACALVMQDLKIGVTATSLNKVYGKDFIPKTGCMLGTLYGDVNPSTVKWPCIIKIGRAHV